MKPIIEWIKNLQKAIPSAQFPSTTAKENDDDKKKETTHIEDIAEQFLRQFTNISGVDNAFGLRDRNGKFFTRNKEVIIRANNLVAWWCMEDEGTQDY